MSSLRLLPPVARPPHDPLWVTLNATQGWRAAIHNDTVIRHSDTALTLKVTAGARSLLEPSGSFGGLVPPALVAVSPGGVVLTLDSRFRGNDNGEEDCGGRSGAMGNPATVNGAAPRAVFHGATPHPHVIPAKAEIQGRKFDPCSCEFILIPCLGGWGAEARQFKDPTSITIANGNLYLADAGNARVSVFALREYILRGFLRPPAAAELATLWKPVSVVADPSGRIFVADPNNGCIHRFNRRGVWQTRFANLGAVKHLATDRDGRLYVIVDGATDVLVLNGDGIPLERVSDVEAIADRFDRLPFDVTASGALVLECGAFDQHGDPVDPPTPVTTRYAERGRYVTQALDSAIHRCQWHSVTLCGETPPATSVIIRTYTADVELPTDIIDDLPDDAWDVHPIARNVCGDWDCLILSNGGRYLWLRLDLIGGGTVTPRLDSIRVEFPRISLRRYLPAVFGEDPAASDFTDRFLGIFDKTFREIESHIDNQARFFDPRSTPASAAASAGGGAIDFLSWIASWIGLTVDRRWPEAKRRELVRLAPKLYDVRGTRGGLWRLLSLYLGIDERHAPPLILEHFQLRRWLFVGGGRLGDQAVLWGRRIVNRSQLDSGAQLGAMSGGSSTACGTTFTGLSNSRGGSQLIGAQDPYRDPFHVHSARFTVFVPGSYGRSAQQRKGLETLLRTESPAHTEYTVEYVEPRFRIGVQSMIGLDAVIGRYPSGGVTVGSSALGRASVLSEGRDGANSQGRQVPSMRVGGQARIGATTRLD